MHPNPSVWIAATVVGAGCIAAQCDYELEGGGLGDLTSAEEAHQLQIYHIFFLVIRLPSLQS